jgi:hypothetical protein
LPGYVAPSNQTQVVTGSSTTLFTGVYSLISTNIGAPTGVSATEGAYTNHIRVTWQGVPGATGYEVWRNTVNDKSSATLLNEVPALRLQSAAYPATPERLAEASRLQPISTTTMPSRPFCPTITGFGPKPGAWEARPAMWGPAMPR